MNVSARLPAILKRASRSQGGFQFLLVLVILMALGLRLARLSFQPLWWDEGWSLYFATTNVGSLLELTAVDIHPPLYYLLLHLWISVLGPSALSVRLLSVLIGVGTIPLLYFAGRRLWGRGGGLLAALLLAISPFHIYYSQEVRMYGLVTLAGLATLAFTLSWQPGTRRSKSGRGSLGVWLGYVLAATAALYTQYYAAFMLVALNLVVFIRWLRSSPLVEGHRRSWRGILPWLGAQVAVLLLYLPWLWYAGEKLVTYVRFKVTADSDVPQGLVSYLGRHLASFNWGHAEGPLANWWWLGLLPLAVLLAALVCLLRPRYRNNNAADRPESTRRLPHVVGWPAVAILLALLGCGFVVNRIYPFNPPRSERLLLLALPAYLLLLTSGMLVLWRRGRTMAIWVAASYLLAALVSLGFFYAVPRYPDDDYRPLVARVRALGLPGDAVVCIHPWQVGYFQAYMPDASSRPALVLTPRQVIPYERQLWADDPGLMATDLKSLLDEHGRIWLLDHRAMSRFLEAPIEAYLAQQAYPVLGEWYGSHTVLSLFSRGSPLVQPVTARFGSWLALNGAALSPGQVESGWGIVAVDLVWQLSAVPNADYMVGLRLVSSSGYIWAQSDVSPGSGLEQFSQWAAGTPRLDHYALLVPAGTPPGDYRVTLRVYRSQDVAVLPVAFEGGSGGEVVLGTVHVVRPQVPPPAQALTFDWPLQVDFGDRLRLLGINVPETSALLPGEAVQIDLLWQALADPGEDFLPRLQLVDSGDQVVAEVTEKPVANSYPTAWWRSGEVVRDPHSLPIPAQVPAGLYRLTLGLIRAANGTPVQFKPGRTLVDLARIEVGERPHNFEPTLPQYDQTVRFGSSVELEGYDLAETPLAPGSSLTVTLHWHALETPDRNYYTFVHLLNRAGGTLAQHDGTPGEGELPTLGWLPGEYLTDTHVLNLPFDLPEGEYHLGIGLYDPATGERLGDRVLIDTPVRVSSVH
jgi:uncharacterized membrane protein